MSSRSFIWLLCVVAAALGFSLQGDLHLHPAVAAEGPAAAAGVGSGVGAGRAAVEAGESEVQPDAPGVPRRIGPVLGHPRLAADPVPAGEADPPEPPPRSASVRAAALPEEPLLRWLAGEHPEIPEPERRALIEEVTAAARQRGIELRVLAALIETESDFNPEARGRSGEIGLMQLLPSTAGLVARDLGIARPGAEELENPRFNLALGTAFLAGLFQQYGSWEKALTVYNAGPRATAPNAYAERVLGLARRLPSS